MKPRGTLLGSSRLWRSSSRLPRFLCALKLLKKRKATQAGADLNDCGLWRRDLTLRSLTNVFMPHNETIHEFGVLSDIFTLWSDVKLMELARRQKGFSKLKMFATRQVVR